MSILKMIRGDCREELPKMESKSVDLTLTSPPYNMNLRIRNGKYCSRQIVKEISTKYEGYDDNLPMDEYHELNKTVIDECLRISNIVFYNVQIVTGNKPAIFRLMGEYSDRIKEIVVWDKITSPPAMKYNCLNSGFELIIVLEDSAPESRLFESAQFERGTLSNIWRIKRANPQKGHMATFPAELAERVISSFCPIGGTVLDPFMGTGTTGIACKATGRDFTGIEISHDYHSASVERCTDLFTKPTNHNEQTVIMR